LYTEDKGNVLRKGNRGSDKWKKSELKIYKANMVVSAVYLEGKKGELAFRYSPQSFRTGKIITSITVLMLIAYLAYIVYSKVKKTE